ncbi:hypothetical protein GQ457_11G007600 [Hibiscus cannabinus]
MKRGTIRGRGFLFLRNRTEENPISQKRHCSCRQAPPLLLRSTSSPAAAVTNRLISYPSSPPRFDFHRKQLAWSRKLPESRRLGLLSWLPSGVGSARRHRQMLVSVSSPLFSA